MSKFFLGSMLVDIKKVNITNVRKLKNGYAYEIKELKPLYNHREYLYVNNSSSTQKFLYDYIGETSDDYLNKPFYIIKSDLICENRIIGLITLDKDIHLIEDYNLYDGNNIITRYGKNFEFIEYYSALNIDIIKDAINNKVLTL